MTMATTQQNKYGYENLNWKDKLSFFQGNKEAAQYDIQRATNKANLQKATGDMSGYNNSMNWVNQVKTATGDVGKTPQQDYIKELTNTLYQRVKQPQQTTFNYNPQTDPQYAAALSRAQSNIQQGNNMNMAEMNRRGILNSTITSDRGSQIAAQEMGNVERNIVPALVEQAYNRFLNQQSQDQQNLMNMADMLNTLTKQDQTSYDRDTYAKEYVDKLSSDKQSAELQNVMDVIDKFGVGVQPSSDLNALFKQVQGLPTLKAKEEQRTYFTDLVDMSDKLGFVVPELARMIGVQPYSNTLSAKEEINQAAYNMGMLKVSERNAATSEKNAANTASSTSFNQFIDAWKAMGAAPHDYNLNGRLIEKGTPYFDKVTSRGNESAYDYSSDIDRIVDLYVTKDPYDGKVTVANPTAMRNAIIALNMSDTDTDRYLAMYELPIN